jgi:hypothetical protein
VVGPPRFLQRVFRFSILVVLAVLGLSVPAYAQTCNYVPKPIADNAMRFLTEGRETQYYCAPCHDRRAVKIVVAEAEVRQLDTYNHQVLINGRPTDLAYLYLFDPGRKRWRNLGLAVRCHEEDDVPPTLPANRVAP